MTRLKTEGRGFLLLDRAWSPRGCRMTAGRVRVGLFPDMEKPFAEKATDHGLFRGLLEVGMRGGSSTVETTPCGAGTRRLITGPERQRQITTATNPYGNTNPTTQDDGGASDVSFGQFTDHGDITLERDGPQLGVTQETLWFSRNHAYPGASKTGFGVSWWHPGRRAGPVRAQPERLGRNPRLLGFFGSGRARLHGGRAPGLPNGARGVLPIKGAARWTGGKKNDEKRESSPACNS